MDTSLQNFIENSLHALPSELLSLFFFFIPAFFLLLFFKMGGAAGIFCFINLVYIAANIQVLHVAQFSFFEEPMALGTVLFAMTYLATDMLVEHYGQEKARKSVLLSFMAQIAFTLFMVTTLAHPALANNEYDTQVYNAMSTLFLPAPRIMIASLTAYFLSQLLDIWIFKHLSDVTHTKYVWLRTGIASLLSALVDNIIFSILAWVLLSPTPIDMHSLIFTYILGTYIARAFVALAGIPVMYLSYYFKPTITSGD